MLFSESKKYRLVRNGFVSPQYTLCKNHFYKNVEAEIYPKILENVWAKIRTSSGSAKLYAFLKNQRSL